MRAQRVGFMLYVPRRREEKGVAFDGKTSARAKEVVLMKCVPVEVIKALMPGIKSSFNLLS